MSTFDGIRSICFLSVTSQGSGWLNWGVLGGYLALLIGVGIYFAKREKSTEDFFLAGRRIPWWAAGLSIFGTQLSAITYLAMPARAYATDWSLLSLNVGILAIAPLVVYVYIPIFRGLNVTTAAAHSPDASDALAEVAATTGAPDRAAAASRNAESAPPLKATRTPA